MRSPRTSPLSVTCAFGTLVMMAKVNTLWATSLLAMTPHDDNASDDDVDENDEHRRHHDGSGCGQE